MNNERYGPVGPENPQICQPGINRRGVHSHTIFQCNELVYKFLDGTLGASSSSSGEKEMGLVMKHHDAAGRVGYCEGQVKAIRHYYGVESKEYEEAVKNLAIARSLHQQADQNLPQYAQPGALRGE